MGQKKTVPIPDCFMHQFGRYRTIDSSANGTNNASFRTAYFPDARDLFTDKFFLFEVIICDKVISIKCRCVP